MINAQFASMEFSSKELAYLATYQLCEDIAVDLDRDPAQVTDKFDVENDVYSRQCHFTLANRMLVVEQYGPKYTYKLTYSDDYIKEFEETVEELLAKIRVNAEFHIDKEIE